MYFLFCRHKLAQFTVFVFLGLVFPKHAPPATECYGRAPRASVSQCVAFHRHAPLPLLGRRQTLRLCDTLG